MTRTIYRFNLDPSVIDKLTYFAKKHQYDSLINFKEAWILFCKDNDSLIQTESRRLFSLGFNGDPTDKMYKAARYYFREKIEKTSQIKTSRRVYISISPEVIDSMDTHISTQISSGSSKPADLFNSFCKMQQDLILSEIIRLRDDYHLDDDHISDKIKKTFKNRCFIFTRSI